MKPETNALGWLRGCALGTVAAMIIGIFYASANSGALELLCAQPRETYYNLLVEGFKNGHLNVNREAPPALAKLADPFDPAANLPVRWDNRRPVHDLSYYHGKLYLYFGVTPALVLFWPFATLTGHYLFHRDATVIFFAVGFLAASGLLLAIRRRYFAEIREWVAVAGIIALGLASGIPMVVARSDVYEVAIGCGYALTMLSLVAIWLALHQPARRICWLALASFGYGLAVGSRPSLLFGAAILLIPVLQSWRETRQRWWLVLAAVGPVTGIGLGLMAYNVARFGHPTEFGMRYQLSTQHLDTIGHFSPRFLWINFKIYFLEPARWVAHFPFVHPAFVPELPPGHFPTIEYAFGILACAPFVWLALAVPTAWRVAAPGVESWRWFLAAVGVLLLAGTVTLGCFFAAEARYQIEFVPELVLLAVTGVFGLEKALAARPGRRLAARLLWGMLLIFSVTFNIFGSLDRHAEAHHEMGNTLEVRGQLEPAATQYGTAVRFNPDFAKAHNRLAIVLAQTGQAGEASAHYLKALELETNSAVFHYTFADFLFQRGEVAEAMFHYQKAIVIKPGEPEARISYGSALLRTGRVGEAAFQYEQALKLDPDFSGAYENLCSAAWVLATSPDASVRNGEQAVEFARQAERISGGGDPLTSVTLAAAYAETGRFPEAISLAERVSQMAGAQNSVGLAAVAGEQLKSYQSGKPLRGTAPLPSR